MNDTNLQRVAIIGGSRIPFCRSNTFYAEQTNLDLLSGALQGLVNKYSLQGLKIDEVMAGAVLSQSKDFNLAREAVLSTELSPLTTGITLQQACGTSLQAALSLGAKIASGQIDCAIAAGSDMTSDAPIVFKRKFARRLIRLNSARSFKQKMAALKGFSPLELAPQAPGVGEPRTGLSMGLHCERMAREWQIEREAQDQLACDSHHKAAAAYSEGFYDDLVEPHAGVMRDNNLRPDTSMEQLAKLKRAYDRTDKGTLTAGNSTPLTDGAAAVLLASEEWAEKHKMPVQAYLTAGRSASVDFVQDEGLLMAPTVAVSEMLNRQELQLQDFDFFEIHEELVGQVLCKLKAGNS